MCLPAGEVFTVKERHEAIVCRSLFSRQFLDLDLASFSSRSQLRVLDAKVFKLHCHGGAGPPLQGAGPPPGPLLLLFFLGLAAPLVPCCVVLRLFLRARAERSSHL